jgi:PAS domain-containing protein
MDDRRNIHVGARSMTDRWQEERVLAAVMEERRRLAGELHDCIGGTLTGVALGLGALQRTAHDDQSREKLEELAQAVRRGLDEIRTLSFSLQLPWCEPDTSFEAAIAQFATGFGRRTGLKISLDVTPPCAALSGNVALVLLRVLQEALFNVHRHAGATSVRVSLLCDDKAATLVIQDDGCGIDLAEGAPPTGTGLASMTDHVREAGGFVRFENSRPGTTVLASLPIQSEGNPMGAAPQEGHEGRDRNGGSDWFMFVLRGPELRYEFANPTYLRLIGEQQVVGRRLLDVLPDIEPQYPEIVGRVLQTGETFVRHDMQRVIRKYGVTRTLYIDMKAMPLFGHDGVVEAVLVEGRDVTARWRPSSGASSARGVLEGPPSVRNPSADPGATAPLRSEGRTEPAGRERRSFAAQPPVWRGSHTSPPPARAS